MRRIATLAVAGFVWATAAAHADPFMIVEIAHSTTDGFVAITGVGSAFSTPTINNAGEVAFRGRLASDRQVVATGRGGALSTLADTTDALFGDFVAAPSINDAGQVAFNALLDGGGRGIFIRGGGPDATVAISPGTIGGALINASGVAAFNTSTGGSQILTGSGGPTSALASAAIGIRAYNTDPAINASGAGAFGGFLNGRQVVYATNGDPDNPTAIVTEGPCASSTFDSFGNPDLNDSGVLIFRASLCPGAGGGHGLYLYGGGVLTPLVLTTSSAFVSFESNNASQTPFGPGINNAGQIAFVAGLDAGGEALFGGLDALADRIIGTGDLLFGRSVQAVDVFRAINDNGQIAFRAAFVDGSEGIYRADPAALPTPEPASLIMVGLGLALFARRLRSRARDRGGAFVKEFRTTSWTRRDWRSGENRE